MHNNPKAESRCLRSIVGFAWQDDLLRTECPCCELRINAAVTSYDAAQAICLRSIPSSILN